MRVTHLTSQFKVNGTGISDFIATLAIAQSSENCEVAVLHNGVDGAVVRRMDEAGVHLRKLPASIFSWRQLYRARLLIRESDIVHIHTVRALVALLVIDPSALALKSVATIHNPYNRQSVAMLGARRPVVLSSRSASRLTRILHKKVHFVPNPVIDDEFKLSGDPAGPPPAKAATLQVLYVGGLNKRKGVDILLKAWRLVEQSHSDTALWIIGNREDQWVEDLALELGLRSAVFVGFTREPNLYMRQSDVLVLPSRGEGFPLVLLQARLAGLPIVATNVDGVYDALDEGEAGILIQPDSPHDLQMPLNA